MDVALLLLLWCALACVLAPRVGRAIAGPRGDATDGVAAGPRPEP